MRLAGGTSSFIALLVLLGSASAVASGVPVTVSPGTATGVRVGDPCPTFSWGAVPAASAYQLVVYRLDQDGGELEPVLRQELPGSASSWTPSIERCLEPGGRYAWSVQALGKQADSEWSAPSFFEVAAGPSEAEVQEALAVVRLYMAGRSEVPAAAEEIQPSFPEVSREAAAGAPESPAAPVATGLTVDGNVAAASFTGNGSSLVGVATDVEMAAHSGYAFAHHVKTTDTTCDGAVCDGASFTNVDADLLDGLDSDAFALVSERVFNSEVLPAGGASLTMNLDCPSGKYLAAGGWNHERQTGGRSKDVYVYANGPEINGTDLSTTRWVFGFRSDDSSNAVVVYGWILCN